MAGFDPAIQPNSVCKCSKELDGRLKCLARGHGGHLFGDMGYTLESVKLMVVIWWEAKNTP
jgi:hypothetical protein